MDQVAYLYLPSVTPDVIATVFNTFEPYGFRQSHIDKDDPPTRRRVTLESAIAIILGGSPGESSNYTFVKDERSGINLTFIIWSDPRWPCSEVSMSFPKRIPALPLCEALFSKTNAFACISGRAGGGKGQDWRVSLLAPSCPELLRAKLAGV